jgi:DNA-binding HxlR family transcriptional regulator
MHDKYPVPASDDQCETLCPVAQTAALIEGKWTTRIIRDLLSGKKRYSELQRSLSGISPKVLADRLRFLEEQGMIVKTIYPVVPPHTEYELTSRGLELRVVIEAMAQFWIAGQH